MKRVEQYIKDYTRNCSNSYWDKNSGDSNYSWLTPDDARKVAEIARKETINEVCEWLDNNKEEYQYKAPYNYFDMEQCIEDLKKYLEDKV